MDRWQAFTLRGMTEYRQHDFRMAALMHNSALNQARLDCHGCGASPPAPLAITKVMVSCFNLADCHVALADPDEACDCYIAAQLFLMDLGDRTDQDASAEQARLHALSRLHLTWTDFMHCHGRNIAMCKRILYHRRMQFMGNIPDETDIRH